MKERNEVRRSDLWNLQHFGTAKLSPKGIADLKERQRKSVIAKLRKALHDLLGPFDGRDPETDGPIDLETSGARIRKAQAVLAEVE